MSQDSDQEFNKWADKVNPQPGLEHCYWMRLAWREARRAQMEKDCAIAERMLHPGMLVIEAIRAAFEKEHP